MKSALTSYFNPIGKINTLRQAIKERENTVLERERTIHILENRIKERENTVLERERTIRKLGLITKKSEGSEHIEDHKDQSYIDNIIKEARTQLEGWCSPEKTSLLTRYIQEEKPQVCVEIGVFGGSSLFPCAAALKVNGQGKIFGIESWSAEVAVENPTNEANDVWWKAVDFCKIRTGVFDFLFTHPELIPYIAFVETSSAKASTLFDQIDFLHIDGSHSIINAAQDVLLYATKVKNGGIVFMDDIEWPSTQPAYQILLSFCDELQTIRHESHDHPSCSILRKR